MVGNDAIAGAVASSSSEKQPPPAFACHPGYALDRELLPELEAAVAFLQDEVAQLRLGKHDHRLQELIEGPPLPGDKFQTLLSVWKVPAIPAGLAEMFKTLQQVQLREQQQQHEADEAKQPIDVTEEDDDEAKSAEEKPSVVEISSDSAEESDNGDSKEAMENEDEEETSASEIEIVAEGGGEETKSQSKQETETALASLKVLRKSMLLDVLSKIISVAKSKGVDPAMFSSSADKEAEFMDLEAISSDVQSGAISEWEAFADHVYEFCQHVITDAEKREQHEAKQKGVELLHFARTLTETLRKASVKKEESLLQGMDGKASDGGGAITPSPRSEDVPVNAAAENQQEDAATPPEPASDALTQSAVETDRKAKTPPPAHTQTSPKRPSVMMDPLTPNRISARIRQRGSSFSDLASPQAGHTPRNDETGGAQAPAADTETRGRKRPRAASNASSATATPPPTAAAAAVMNVNTASEDDNMSESESQISASEAESQKRRGSSRARETASASSSAQTTPVKRAKTRKRRPVLPATRVSSRQQKRRAARAQAATGSGATTAPGDDGEDDGKDGSENNDGEDNDTAQGEDDEDDNNTNTNSDAATGAEAASPAPVLLTKAGRPRKKPGRKPAAWKNKADGK